MRGEPIAYWGWSAATGEANVHFVGVGKYPGGEPLVTEWPVHVDKVLLRPTSMHDFIGGLFWIQALQARAKGPRMLILPCVPGARQDRLNTEGDYLFTAKSSAGLINALNVPSVVILDPHSTVTPALINNCTSFAPPDYLPEAVFTNKYNWVLAPDAGSDHRALGVARALGVPVSHGWKVRDVRDGKLTGFGWDKLPIDGSRILVVDDLCDGGGTFIGLAEKVRADRDCKLDLFVTHGLFTKGTHDLLKHYDRIYTTDSVPAQRPGVNVDEVCLRLLTQGAL